MYLRLGWVVGSLGFIGSIIVTSKSSITLAANNDNLIVCDGVVFNDMVYNLTGGVRGVTVTGLPNGLNISLDDPFNPTIATVAGIPDTRDTALSVYDFTISTTANQFGCDEMSITGKISIEPVDTLTLSSSLASIDQSECIGSAIDPIIYELSLIHI